MSIDFKIDKITQYFMSKAGKVCIEPEDCNCSINVWFGNTPSEEALQPLYRLAKQGLIVTPITSMCFNIYSPPPHDKYDLADMLVEVYKGETYNFEVNAKEPRSSMILEMLFDRMRSDH